MTRPVVACVLVKGHVGYSTEYVVRLRAMVRAKLKRPHRFICLTDQGHALPDDIEVLTIPTPLSMFGWWSKLWLFSRMFDELVGVGARVLYLDLDTLVTGDLAQLLDFPAPFALVPDGAPNFHGKGRRQVVKRFNSSVMVYNAGEHRDLWQDFHPGVAARLWGDQDWIGTQCPDAATFPAGWFPRISALSPDETGFREAPDQVVILCKKPKNADAAQRWIWFEAMWGGN